MLLARLSEPKDRWREVGRERAGKDGNMVGLASPTHIALLLVALLLIFGAKRLPELGRTLGSGMREFRQSISEHSESPAPPEGSDG
jgi:TatA/E family protein of Tat protein translocase